MSESVTRFIIAWLPLILIMGGYLVYARYAQRGYRQHIDRVEAINDRLVDSNSQIIAELRDIKEILRDRK